MDVVIAFLIGLMIGGFFGVFTIALVSVSKDDKDGDVVWQHLEL